ncbi:MAG TPA: nicotinate phosphoribosyltransferase [Candidatus Binataceae bacterium]|nr:nicotinate phosphoribosyltransferase [Candidatus Binataceae bacterium]
MPIDLRLDPSEVSLLNDLYEFTVAAAFFERGMNATASFEVMVRRFPPTRGYMIAAGLQRVLEVLEEFRFDSDAIEHLKSLQLFKPEFLQHLSQLRFTSTVRAIPDGSIFFAGEPVMEIRGPLIETQLLEPLVLNQLGFASLTATKAARCFSVASGRRLVEFGLRRGQGADATLIAARSAYLAGFSGTSNVLAGKRYGMPVFGTMSHSFIMAHDSERRALEDFARTFPKLNTMLVDTYDTAQGVRNVAELAARLAADNIKIQAVRIDSGDLYQVTRQARAILDQHGLADVAIFASGNLDEYRIAELLRAGAPIDAFGVGTSLTVSEDAPSADYTYKLADYADRPRLKTSAGKATVPGRKQVFRGINAAGQFAQDLVGLVDESAAGVTREFRPAVSKVVPMLQTVFENGRRRVGPTILNQSRDHFMSEFAMLGARQRSLTSPVSYPVRLTAALNAMTISERLRAEQLQD